jgi:hypothetical protein
MRYSLFWDVTQHILVVTDVSGQFIFLDYLTLEDGNARLSRNFGNKQSTLRNIPEERRSQRPLILLFAVFS